MSEMIPCVHEASPCRKWLPLSCTTWCTHVYACEAIFFSSPSTFIKPPQTLFLSCHKGICESLLLPLGALFLLLSCEKTMASSVDPLVVGRVIGEVIDMFMPSVSMSIYYGNKQVTNGCDIKPSLTVDPPTVNIAGRVEQLYTLVMTDPDAPSPSEPSMREWVHWIVVDIPGATDPSQGREILPYMGPRPPIGIHRYVFVLFQQQAPAAMVAAPPTRANFSTRAFAARYGLGLPVAAIYFNAHKEPATKRR